MKSAKKVVSQISDLKVKDKQIQTAHAMLNEVRSNAGCIEEQARLAVLGQFMQTIASSLACATSNLKDKSTVCKQNFEAYDSEQTSEKKNEVPVFNS